MEGLSEFRVNQRCRVRPGMTERRARHDEGVFASAMRDEGMCVIVDATICERQDQADKRKACL